MSEDYVKTLNSGTGEAGKSFILNDVKIEEDIDNTLTEHEKAVRADHEKVAQFFDHILSNSHQWRFYGLYLIVQCVIGLSFVISLIANSLGRVTLNLTEELLIYFFEIDVKKEALPNNSTSGPFQYFNIGASVLTPIVLIIFYSVAKAYVYIKTGHCRRQTEE